MKRWIDSVCQYGSVVAVALFFSHCVLAEFPVAGIAPDQRPSGAPVVGEVEREGSWYRGALFGLTPPYPESLKFLEDQGNWYTPFNNAGMKGRYDIRGLHE